MSLKTGRLEEAKNWLFRDLKAFGNDAQATTAVVSLTRLSSRLTISTFSIFFPFPFFITYGNQKEKRKTGINITNRLFALYWRSLAFNLLPLKTVKDCGQRMVERWSQSLSIGSFPSPTNQIAGRLGDNNKSVDLINYSLAFLNEMDVMASIDDILLRIDRIALFHKYVRKSTRLSSRDRSIYFLLILFLDISSRVRSPRGFAQSGGLNRSSQYISFLTSHCLSCSLVGWLLMLLFFLVSCSFVCLQSFQIDR